MDHELPTAEEDLVCTEFATDKEAQNYYSQLRRGFANDRWQARCADALIRYLLDI
ncbi:BZ3500_MvSof-1268-A1-R1_Chr3-3g06566 [Microbotryum saponariae]|uniref:BZ3500_MvSof-1268-A1-R1_Chr3-3g06566 protein n=1 Tax=Microbotryum saponariae TaxID=289078 RepID=A0A2X0LYJ5_9BASI|nr:BZ3500_MvSof-1268-A1-R1_Chr3-3g06566 [Microbotryum saponariae]SDA04533.1 BZ3501_MvSof-1269-A2-R1_Chr3-2g06253 [Microbotryum saponariae]